MDLIGTQIQRTHIEIQVLNIYKMYNRKDEFAKFPFDHFSLRAKSFSSSKHSTAKVFIVVLFFSAYLLWDSEIIRLLSRVITSQKAVKSAPGVRN